MRWLAEPKVLGEEEVPAMKWGAPDTEGLVKFLVEEKSFNEDRVRRAVERINSSRGKSNQGACCSGIAGCLLDNYALPSRHQYYLLLLACPFCACQSLITVGRQAASHTRLLR
jgi:hypothetical protein